MKISILTLFPEMFQGPFDHSILKRAKEKKLLEIDLINIRDFGEGKHQIVDDTPYGGGGGMVMRVDILHRAIEYARHSGEEAIHPKKIIPMESSFRGRRLQNPDSGTVIDPVNGARMTKQKVILLSAGGKTFKQSLAKQYSKLDHLILICGHYEGVDERIMQYVDEEISIGDFVLTGGELPAMLITDSVARLLEGVITQGATEDESFSQSDQILLEYPHYTKPRSYKGQDVPEILLSGNHKRINEWRKTKSLEKTKLVRPDLLKK